MKQQHTRLLSPRSRLRPGLPSRAGSPVENLWNIYSPVSMISVAPRHTSMWVHADYYYKALQFIRLNYPDPELSVARIADHMGISRSHLYRIFDSVSHQSIQDCILSFRLKKAAALLKNSAAAIGEIAQSCGFSNQSHFTSIFKQYYGETPSSYRKDK